MQNFKIKDKVENLLAVILQEIIMLFPKNQSVMKNKLIESIFSLHENIVLANLNVGNIRAKHQKAALSNIYTIDMIFGYMKDLGIFEKKKFMSMVANLNEIKKMINGWIESEKNKP